MNERPPQIEKQKIWPWPMLSSWKFTFSATRSTSIDFHQAENCRNFLMQPAPPSTSIQFVDQKKASHFIGNLAASIWRGASMGAPLVVRVKGLQFLFTNLIIFISWHLELFEDLSKMKRLKNLVTFCVPVGFDLNCGNAHSTRAYASNYGIKDYPH